MRGKGWRKCKLGDVGENFAMGPFGSNIKTENFIKSGIPVIRGKNLNFPKYVDGEFVFISERKADELKNSNCFPDDIIVTHRGTLGQVCLVSQKQYQRYIVSQSGMKFSINPEKADCQFVFYYLKSDIGQHELLQHESQVGVPSISNPLTSLKSVNIFLPPLSEQKSIVSILSSLDDKIDLLHRQNKTLEALAETLFRQWFMEEADESWKKGTIFQLVDIIGGGTPKTGIPEYWDGNIPWLSGGDIASNHKTITIKSEKSITDTGLTHSSAKLLPKYSTVISARGTVGKYCLLGEKMAFSQSNYGIIPKIRDCYFFAYLLINYIVEELKASAYGSVVDTITTETFKQINIPIPTEEGIVNFNNSVLPYFLRIEQNQRGIYTLERLRDTLLPRLMNGEAALEILEEGNCNL
jgi:type I restriction enzyme S subunit